MRFIIRFIIIIVGALTLGIAGPAEAREPRAPINLGPNTGQHTMLTYDDCPFAPWTGIGKRYAHGETPESALARYKATVDEFARLGVATVIVPTGMCVNRYRNRLGADIAAYARARGQYVISHTTDHRHLIELGKPGIRWQVRNGLPSYWVRPPHGEVNARVLSVFKEMGVRAWRWTWSGGDWRGYPSEKVVTDTVTRCNRPGDTCLLHMNPNTFTPGTSRQIVEGLRAQNVRVCGKNKPTAVHWVRLYCKG